MRHTVVMCRQLAVILKLETVRSSLDDSRETLFALSVERRVKPLSHRAYGLYGQARTVNVYGHPKVCPRWGHIRSARTVSTVSSYGLYGHARSPVRSIRSVATVSTVTCGHPERYKYSCQIRSFNRLLQALVGESSLQAKSMEFSHMDFSLMETTDLEMLLKITEIDIKLVELEKKQRKANRKKRRMRVQWTRDWIMRKTLFGLYDLCLGVHCLLLDLSMSLAPGILTRRVLVLGTRRCFFFACIVQTL